MYINCLKPISLPLKLNMTVSLENTAHFLSLVSLSRCFTIQMSRAIKGDIAKSGQTKIRHSCCVLELGPR